MILLKIDGNEFVGLNEGEHEMKQWKDFIINKNQGGCRCEYFTYYFFI